MKKILPFLLLLIGFWNPMRAQVLNNTFYVFNNCVRTLPGAPTELDDQLLLITELGYDGMAGHHSQDNLLLIEALDRAGLKMPEVYWPVKLMDSGEVSFDSRLHEIIKKIANQDLLVTLVLSTDKYMDDPESGDPLFAKGLREIADFAADYGAKIAIYPHVNNYCETVGHTWSLTKLIDRKNVGMVFNLCHFLKVEGEKGWESKVEKALPNIFMVSINGADSGDTQAMDWDRLIQPLGEGSFNTFELVKFLIDHGYKERFGLQCYNIDQDCEKVLKKSMDTWKAYKKRLNQ